MTTPDRNTQSEPELPEAGPPDWDPELPPGLDLPAELAEKIRLTLAELHRYSSMRMSPAASAAARHMDLQLKALADPTRRRIVELLKSRGCCSCVEVSAAAAGLCVCDLEKTLQLSQPTVTHHVQVLRDAGLVETQKIGRWLYCRRNEGALDRLAGWLKQL